MNEHTKNYGNIIKPELQTCESYNLFVLQCNLTGIRKLIFDGLQTT